MNWLLIVVLAIIVGFTMHGYRKGIIRMVISLVSMILSILIAFVAAPVISDGLCNNEAVMSYVSEGINEGLHIEEKCQEITGDVAAGIKETGKKSTNLNNAQKETVIQELTLPEKIKNTMLDNTAQIINTNGKATAVKFSKSVSEYIARIVIRSMTYILLFMIFKAILRIVTKALRVVEKIPVVKSMDGAVGGVVGLASGLLIVWVVFLFLFLLSGTPVGTASYQCINDSSILTFLYDNNILLQWVLKTIM